MPIITAITAAAKYIVASFTWEAFGVWAASTAASIGLSSWLGNRKKKKAEADARARELPSRTESFSTGPARYPIGRTLNGGVVVFWEEDWDVKGTERFNPINGGADDAHMIIALADGPCDKIEGVMIGDDYFPVKFTDDAKQKYLRREARDGDDTRTLMGLPLELDPQTTAWFDEQADRWRETNNTNSRLLDEANDEDKESIRKAALAGAISVFPYLDATGSDDNWRSVREYTDDRDNSLIHGKQTPFADKWSNDHKMTGVAGVHVRLRQWTKHKMRADKVFRGGVPQISFLMRGMIITHPDPNASTGNITQWTDNAAAVRYFFHNKRLGVDESAIDRESFVKAYKICDETIIPTKPTTWPGVSGEPTWAEDDSIWGFKKYSINGVLFSDDDPYDISKQFDMQWQGVAVEDGGVFFYFPGTDDPETDAITVDGNDAIELVSIGVAPSLSERYNSATISIEQSAYHEWKPFTLEEVIDQEKTDEVDLGQSFPADIGSVRWINNPAQAYMMALIALRRYRNSMTYRIKLPIGDDDNPVKYLEMTPGRIYNLSIDSEGIAGRRVMLTDKSITKEGMVDTTFIDSPLGMYDPTYELPDIPAPPTYTPTKMGSRPITPSNLRVSTVARSSSDGSVHFQITALVDANPLQVRFRLTIDDLVLTQTVNDSTYTFDVNVPRQQMELAAFHVDKDGMESIPARLIFTPDYRHIIMPTPRWNEVQHFGSNIVMKFEPEEFTASVSGVEVRYTRLDLDTTTEIPTITEETWSSEGELLTTESLQIVHGAVMTANAVVPRSGRYNLYARYLSNVSGAEPVRGPISALKEITIDIPTDSLNPGDAGFTGTMYNLDPWVSRTGATKGETLLLPSHTPASTVKFDVWNGNVSNSPVTTGTIPAWPFGRCVGYDQSLDETNRNASTGLWTGDNATLYRTLPIDLGESKRVDVRAEVHSFAPGTIRPSSLRFTVGSIYNQRWRINTAVTSIPLPAATGNTGQIVYSIVGLPVGLTFDSTTRTITGTPTIASSGTAVYRAVDGGGGNVSINILWTVASQTSYIAPGRPNGVTIDPSITTATVSWLPGIASSNHRVEYSSDNSTWKLVGYTYIDAITITGLTASTTYYVRVRAENGRGASSWTTPAIQFTTLATLVAPTTPTGLTLTDAVSDTLLVRWNAKTNDHTFDVQWKLATDSAFDDPTSNTARIKTGLQINTVSIDGLAENTSYHIQVRANNTAGTSAWSSSLTATTVVTSTDGPSFVSIEHISGVRPHFKITTNELSGETGTDISIQNTDQPDVLQRVQTGTDPVTGEPIYTWRLLPPHVDIIHAPSGPGPFLVYNVSIGSTYRIGIRKVFYPEDGNNIRELNRETNWTYQTVVFTSVPAQMSPPRVQTNGVFAYSISLEWTAVATATRYRIKYWDTSSPENVLSFTVNNPASSGTIRQSIQTLSQLTEYSFTIQAYNTNGWGIDSSATTRTTKKYETTPEIPGGREIYPISSTEAIVVWDKDDQNQARWYNIDVDQNDDSISHTIVHGNAQFENINVPSGKLAHRISNLVQGQTYSMRIQGENPAAPSGGRRGLWGNFPTITMPPTGTPNDQYVFGNSIPITLSTSSNSRDINFSFAGLVRTSLHSFQIRYRETPSTTTGYVDDWQLIPNAAINTHSSGTRTFTGSFDPGFSRRTWEVQVRAYVSTTGRWGAGFSEWYGDQTRGTFFNNQFQLTATTPSFTQKPESGVIDVEWEPYTEEFETPGGSGQGETANQFDITINNISLPFKRGDFTGRNPRGRPLYDGDGIYDASFFAKGGSPMIIQSDFLNNQRFKTDVAKITISTIRVPITLTETPNAGPYVAQNGRVWGEFLLNSHYKDPSRPINIEDGDPFKFTSVGGYTNVDTQTTYYLASRYSPKNLYGTSTRRYFVYTNKTRAQQATDLGVLDLQGPVDAYATAVLSITAHDAREPKRDDVITAKITRVDPYQKNAEGTTQTYTVLDPTSVPQPVSNVVQNITHRTEGRDVIFNWDVTEITGTDFEYEVSVVEDIPGEPLPSETEGGDPVTVREVVEQDSSSTTFTKTGGRNEHFTIRIRQHRLGQYGPYADYVYAPVVANNTVGKVYGLTADPVGNDVRVRWGQTDNATGYELSRSTDGGVTWGAPDIVTGNTNREHTYTAVASTDFSVRIRGLKGSQAPYTYSLSYSILSWKASTNPSSNVVEDITTAVAVARDGSVYVDWSEAENADHYRLEYLNNNIYVLVSDNIAHDQTQWQTHVSDANSTTFRIRGENPSLTNGVWTYIPYIAETLFAVPHPSIYTISTYTSIFVHWPPINGADAYELEWKYATETDVHWRTASNNITSSPYEISGIEEGTEYDIRVRAKDGSNASAWVTTRVSTLSCASFGAPRSLVLIPHTDKVRATWNLMQGAGGYFYQVYISQQASTGYPNTPTLSGNIDAEANPTFDFTLSDLSNPTPPFYVRFRARGRYAGCNNTIWSEYETIRWEPYGIITSPTSITVEELGSDVPVNVKLASKPTANVTLSLEEAVTSGRGNLSTSSLVFTPDNWDTNQTFSVSHIIDDNYSNDNGVIRITPSGAGYGPTNIIDLPVQWVDQGEPEILSSIADVEILETENEVSNITLKTKPTTTVIVSVSSTNTNGFTVAPSSLTFTPSNYDTSQSITIRGIIDNDAQDDTGHIRLSASGGSYNNVTKLIPVTIDDPKPSIITDQGSTMDVNEGLTATIRVKLGKYPNGYASVSISSSNTSGATVSPSILNFHNTNWDDYQSVTITGVSDLDGSDTYSNITLSGGLAASEADDVVIRCRTIDSDNKNIVMSLPSVNVSEGGSQNITAKLSSSPNPNTTTTITATSSDTSVVTVSPSTRSYTPSTFNVDQNFVVSGVEDNQLINRSARITFTSSGGGYSAFQNIPVVVNNTSNPSVEFNTFTPTNVGTSNTLGIRLSHRPTSGVTVICTTANTNGSVNITGSGTIVFTTNNWNTYQNITLSGSGGGGLTVSAELSASASGGGYTGVVNKTNVSFNATATGTKSIVANPTTLALTEGSAGKTITMQVVPNESYRMTATASPAGNVTLGWSTQNTDSQGRSSIVVTPVDDSDTDDETAVVTFTATRNNNSGGTNIPNRTVSVTIDDDDNIVVSRSLVVIAGGSGTTLGAIQSPLNSSNQTSRTISVKLNSQPTSSVSVSLGINVTSGLSTNMRLSTTSLLFTTSNWDSAQSFTLDGTSTITEFTASGNVTIDPSGGGFDSVATVSVPFSITQPVATPELYVQGNTPTTIPEGSTITLDLRIRNQGGNAYNVTPSSSPSGIVTFNSSSYSATNGRFGTIRITASHDADSDDETTTITFTASRGSGGNYPLPSPLSFTITRSDDDAQYVVVESDSINIKESQTVIVKVALNPQPSGSVTVTPSWVGSVSDATFSPSTLTFTTSNWAIYQNISVSVPITSTNGSRTRTLRLTGSGGGYNNIRKDVSINITDNMGFEWRPSAPWSASFNGTLARINYRIPSPPPAGDHWRMVLHYDRPSKSVRTRIYVDRVDITGTTSWTPIAPSGNFNDPSTASWTYWRPSAFPNDKTTLSLYKVVGNEQHTSSTQPIPSAWQIIGTIDDINDDIWNWGVEQGYNSNSSGSGASATSVAEEAIAKSTGGEPATIELDSSQYEYTDPVVVNAEVRPYLDGILPLQIWKTGDTIEPYIIPEPRGGAEPYRISVTGLPAGLQYDRDARKIFGTPTGTAPQMGYATVRLTDTNGNYDQRTMDWHITMDVPTSWSDFDGGIGQFNNPFIMSCSTKGNIKPFYYIPGGTNAESIQNDSPGARYRVMWMQCPTTYPHKCRLVGASSTDYDLVIQVGDEFFFSDTNDDTEYLEVDGHSEGAKIGVYRYEESTTTEGYNNTGDPLIIEWVPTIIDAPEDEAGGLSGAIETPGGGAVINQTNAEGTVPGNDETDIYVLHRNATTGAWTKISTPISSGWNDVGVNARQVCFEFHFKKWDNRAVRSINASYRDQ